MQKSYEVRGQLPIPLTGNRFTQMLASTPEKVTDNLLSKAPIVFFFAFSIPAKFFESSRLLLRS